MAARYTNAERMALTPTEDMILDVDAEYDFDWDAWERAEREQAKKDRINRGDAQSEREVEPWDH